MYVWNYAKRKSILENMPFLQRISLILGHLYWIHWKALSKVLIKPASFELININYVHMDRIKITEILCVFTGNVMWNRGYLMLGSLLLLPWVMWVNLTHKSKNSWSRRINSLEETYWQNYRDVQGYLQCWVGTGGLQSYVLMSPVPQKAPVPQLFV